jgi:hypothetical protein
MLTGDFASIYKEAAPRFHAVGSESEFVSMMKKYQGEFGSFRSANEVAYNSGLDSRVGRMHESFYDLEYEHVRAREHLTMVRSGNGTMELWKLDIQRVE